MRTAHFREPGPILDAHAKDDYKLRLAELREELVINSPESGVWHKTGRNTFATTFLTMEYQVDTSTNSLSAPLFEFDKAQFTGVLNESGDQIELTALVTIFNPDGTQKGNSFPDKAIGIRIPLEVLPNTSHSLPIPATPQ